MRKRALRVGVACVLALLVFGLGLFVGRVGSPVRAWRATAVARAYMSHLERGEYAEALRLYSSRMRKLFEDRAPENRLHVLEIGLPRIRSYTFDSITRFPWGNDYEVSFTIDSDSKWAVMHLLLQEEGGAYVVSSTTPPGM